MKVMQTVITLYPLCKLLCQISVEIEEEIYNSQGPVVAISVGRCLRNTLLYIELLLSFFRHSSGECFGVWLSSASADGHSQKVLQAGQDHRCI